MRQTGYYFVEYKGEKVIAEYADGLFYGVGWTLPEDCVYNISHTPITPEKMAAVDEIVQSVSTHNNGIDAYISIKETLTKHKLI